MSSSVRVQCPNCDKKYNVPPKHLGKSFRCLKCQFKIQTETVDESVVEIKHTPQPLPPTTHPIPESRSTPVLPPAIQVQRRTQFPILILLVVGAIVIGTVSIGLMIYVLGKSSWANLDPPPHHATENLEQALPGGPEGNPRETSRENDAPQRNPKTDLANTGLSREGKYRRLSQQLLADDRSPILKVPAIDPCLQMITIQHFLDSAIGSDLILVCGLNFGGPKFLKKYSELMNSEDAKVRIDAAISAANWGHDVPKAIKLLIQELSSDRNSYAAHVDRVRGSFIEQLVEHYPQSTNDSQTEILQGNNISQKLQAIQWIVDNAAMSDENLTAATQALEIHPEDWDPKTDSDTRRELFDRFHRLFGFSGTDLQLLLQALKNPRNANHRAALLTAIARTQHFRSQWFDKGGDETVGRKIGLQFVPPYIDRIAHFQPSFLARVPSASHHTTLEDLLNAPNMSALAQTFPLHAEEIEYVTYGRVDGDGENTSLSPRPSITVIRSHRDLSKLLVEKFPQTEKQKMWTVSPRVWGYQPDPKTLILGTKNEVRWAVDNDRIGPQIHPAFRLWPDKTSSQILLIQKHQLEAFDIDIRNDQCHCEVRFEHYTPFSEKKRFLLNHAGNNLKSKENVELTFPDQVEKAKQFFRDFATTFRLEVPAFGKQSHGSQEVLSATGNLAWNLKGLRGIQRIVGMPPEKRRPDLEKFETLKKIPNDNSKLESALADLAAEKFAQSYSKDITHFCQLFLEAVVSRIKNSDSPVTVESAEATLDMIRRVAHWLDDTHLETLLEIFALVEFENEMERTKCLATILRQVHTDQSIRILAESDAKVLAEVDYELNSYFPRPPGSISDTSRRERLLSDFDFADVIHHFLVAGDEETQLACVKLIQAMPTKHKRLNFGYPLYLLHSKPTTSDAVRNAIPVNRTSSLLSNVFSTPTVPFDYNQVAPTYRLEGGEIDSSLPKVQVHQIIPFDHPNRTFDLLVPDVDFERAECKIYGRGKTVQPPADLDVRDYQKQLSKIRNDLKNFLSLSGIYVNLGSSETFFVRDSYVTPELAASKWNYSCAALGTRLVSENRGQSGAPFDRIRYYKINGVPKAERMICWSGSSGFLLRWTGNETSGFPDHLKPMIESLKQSR